MNNLKKTPTDYTLILYKMIMSLCMIYCICVIVVVGYRLFYSINPPETITENGYSYQLVDESKYDPPKTIEKYGQTYVLITDTSKLNETENTKG